MKFVQRYSPNEMKTLWFFMPTTVHEFEGPPPDTDRFMELSDEELDAIFESKKVKTAIG